MQVKLTRQLFQMKNHASGQGILQIPDAISCSFGALEMKLGQLFQGAQILQAHVGDAVVVFQVKFLQPCKPRK